MAIASLATVGAPVGGSRTELSLQGEVAWNDELDVRKSARHSSGSHATGIVRQPAGRNDAAVAQSYTSGKNQLKPIQFVFNACTLLNAAGLAYLVYHSQMFAAHASAHTMSLYWRRHLLPGEYGAGSEHHRPDRRRKSFCPLAQGVLVVLSELRNRRGIDCNRFRLHHRQRLATMQLSW